MSRIASLALAALLVSAPALAGNKKKKGDDAPPPASAAVAAPAAGTEAAPAAGTEALHGEWAIVLSDEDKRQLELFTVIFGDPPPTDEQLGALELKEEEKFLVTMMVGALRENPEDPRILEMRKMIVDMPNAVLTMGAGTVSVKIGDVEKKSTWTAQAGEAGSFDITTTAEDGTVSQATFSLAGDTLTMVEAPAPGQPPKTTTFKRK